jgi:hypothetical protein
VGDIEASVLRISRILPRGGHERNFLSHGWEIRGETSRSMKDTRRSERDRVRSGTGTERSGMEDPRGVLGDLRET